MADPVVADVLPAGGVARLSVVVITLNEAHRLAACLSKLDFADELLVVDSGSDDGTQDVARGLGARVLHQDWLGYGRQKQFAVQQAACDWVLCLDADERLSERLSEEIHDLLRRGLIGADQGAYAGYDFPRCNRFLGRWLRHGEGYPDRSLRLFDRRRGRWSESAVHEAVVLEGVLGHLRGDLLHQSQESLSAYLAKQDRYTDLQAAAMLAAGKRAGLADLWLRPLWRFLKFYFLRRGCLDGVPGLVHIGIGCFNSFMKYAKLYALRQGGA